MIIVGDVGVGSKTVLIGMGWFISTPCEIRKFFTTLVRGILGLSLCRR